MMSTYSQEIEDNKALLRELWADKLSIVEGVHIAGACGIVSSEEVEGATLRLMDSMLGAALRQGVVPGNEFEPNGLVRRVASSASASVRNDPKRCNRLGPADRARVRKLVRDIVAYGL